MTEAFQLIEVSLPPEERHDVGPIRPENLARRFRLSDFKASPDATSNTIVIGANGRGKSRLLSAIAETFYRISHRDTKRGLPLNYLHYRYNGVDYIVKRNTADQVLCYAGNARVALAALELPERVIALTLTPHDKFPMGRRRLGSLNPDVHRDEVYEYMGIRDGSSRASIVALLYRSIENIADNDQMGPDKLRQLGRILEFLGYQPRIVLSYSLVGYRHALNEWAHNPKSIFQRESYGASLDERLKRLMDINNLNADDVSRLAARCLDTFKSSRNVEIIVDFEKGLSDSETIRELDLFRKLRAVRLSSVGVVSKSTGIAIDLKQSSSGEMGILSAFLALATVIRPNSLILIDEPEISLHPEWQDAYLKLLMDTFLGYEGCHYLIATHSPLIVSDIGKTNSFVLSMDKDTSIPVGDLSGVSADEILIKAFKVASAGNLYLKQQILKALRLVSDMKMATEEFAELRQELNTVLPYMEEGDPSRELIAELIALDIPDSHRAANIH